MCWRLFSSVLCVVVLQAEVRAQEPAVDSSSNRGPELYGAVYLLGSLAKNRNMNVGGEEFPSTTVRNGAGGGFRAGIFPSFTGYVVGIQAESFGLGHEVSAPASIGSTGTQSGHGTLLAWTTMVSLLVQYPGTLVKPYAGVGAGWSSSFLVDTHIAKGTMAQAGTARDTSLAVQYFAGLRLPVGERLFVFGEYKYFATHYHWGGSLEPSLDLRTHIVAVGVGLSF
jgi:hypothetical protein